jgi:hypothetical protein
MKLLILLILMVPSSQPMSSKIGDDYDLFFQACECQP